MGRADGVAERISGTWVLQQVASRQELEQLAAKTIVPALQTPQIRGFCIRVPWQAIDTDFSLLESGLKLAQAQHVDYSVRFMAGRHTPARVFESGCPFYLKQDRQGRDERVPVPFMKDGTPNRVFEAEYERLVERLAAWCRAHDVHLLHLAWYGQDWAELNHGKEVRAVPGYSYAAWLTAHKRLIDIGLQHAGRDLAVELPFSGYGPLTDAVVQFADHVIEKCGPDSDLFYCQANGWAPGGDWAHPARPRRPHSTRCGPSQSLEGSRPLGRLTRTGRRCTRIWSKTGPSIAKCMRQFPGPATPGIDSPDHQVCGPRPGLEMTACLNVSSGKHRGHRVDENLGSLHDIIVRAVYAIRSE